MMGELYLHNVFAISLNEGVHGQGAFKAIVLAGGPGAGKSYVASTLYGIPRGMSFSEGGLKTVNSDVAFEHLMWKRCLEKDPNMEKKECFDLRDRSPEEWVKLNELRKRAKILRDRLYVHLKNSGTGMVIDTTGNDVKKLTGQIEDLKEAGYDVSVVVVDAPLEIALTRNAARERSVPEDVARDIHAKVRKSVQQLSSIAEDLDIEVIVVNNDASVNPRHLIRKAVGRAIRHTVESPVRNPIGRRRLSTVTGEIPTRTIARKLGSKKTLNPRHSAAILRVARKSPDYQRLLRIKITNPVTNKKILLKTALGKGADHPAFNLAIAVIGKYLSNK